MEELDYNLLYRWFVGLTPDDPVWVPTVFTKNRDRLLDGNIAEAFFNAVVALADRHALISHEHFTVDGTLLEAWASHKSFRPIDDPTLPPSDDDPGNPSVNFRGEKRSNATHRSVTDPDARLTRKTHHGAAFLGYQASVLTENRHGLIVQTDVRAPAYHAERDAALEMLTVLEPTGRRRTLGADRGDDEAEFVAGVRGLGFTPHISPNPTAMGRRATRRSTVARRGTRATRSASANASWRRKSSGGRNPSPCAACCISVDASG